MLRCVASGQITDCKAAGAAGMLGIITQVSGRGTAVMSSYAAALGLDAPVEVRRTLRFPSVPTTFSQSIRRQALSG